MANRGDWPPEKWKSLPVPALAVCGWKGSGKTTLLETALPVLLRRRLRVRVLKHDAHGIRIDHPGKDSDRLFRAGADVILGSPDETARRLHVPAAGGGLADLLAALPVDYDLTLVEGHKSTPVPKVWLQGPDPAPPPDNLIDLLAVLPRDGDRLQRFLAVLDEWLPERWTGRPVYGGILIGGGASRMGSPKQMMERRGTPVLETIAAALELHTGRVVLLGAGPVPDRCAHLTRLPDPPGTAGPIAAMVAAMRWAPAAAWVFASCDLPLLRAEAVAWLVNQRAPGRWAILPRRDGTLEPLLALYEPQLQPAVEAAIDRDRLAPRLLAEHGSVMTPEPPAAIAACWTNINTPDDLARLD